MRSITRKKLAEFVATLGKCGFVLDAGAARGAFSALLAPHPLKIIAVDISMDYVAEIRTAEGGKSFRLLGDLQALPLASNSLDGAVCLEVLEHLTKPERAIEELVRVVRFGGFIVFSVPTYFLERLYLYLYPKWLEVCQHKRVFRKHELENIFKRYGLTVEERFRMHFWPALLWFFHCLLRTPHDGTGVVKKNQWLNRIFENILALLERFQVASIVEQIGGRLIFKSVVFLCRKTNGIRN